MSTSTSRATRLAAAVLCCLLVAGVAAAQARAAAGELFQKPRTFGCVSQRLQECALGAGLAGAGALAVSPDGRTVYAAAPGSDSVAILDRAPDGILVQKPGAAGCVANAGTDGCADARGLGTPQMLVLSPDGRNVYVVGRDSESIAVFDRAADGTLTQKPGGAGCVAHTGGDGCRTGFALDGLWTVTLSPDGRTLYAAAYEADAVTAFARAADGTLTQRTGPGACVADTGGGQCGDATALDGAISVTVSPDGENAYVAGIESQAVAVFDRAADGTLKQKTGTDACVSDTGEPPCRDGNGMPVPDVAAVSPDGRSVYVGGGYGVAVLDRAEDGAVTQKAGPAGCVAGESTDGPQGCTRAPGLTAGIFVAVSPAGDHVYTTSSYSSSMVVFDRAGDGTLAQKPGEAGCIAEVPDSPYFGGRRCADAVAIENAAWIALSPDGQSAYVAGAANDAIAVFDRNAPRAVPAAESGGGGGSPAPPASPGAGAGAAADAAADTSGPVISIPRGQRRLRASRRGIVRFRIGPAAEVVIGKLALRTAHRVRGKRRALGSRAFSAASGQTATLRVRLGASARRLLRRRGKLAVRATIALRDTAGNETVRTFRFRLNAPRRR
ncbi:MAG TPA: beta-propeller fold lactonase family protein [Solirubrobacteraceae bacterium]